MKRVVLFIFLSLLLVGCKEVTFETPQPEGKKPLTAIPKKLQGKYLTETDEGGLSKDTVIITEKGYHFGYYDPSDRSAKNDEYEVGVLSDSLIVKYYKGYYFVNLNERPEWLLRVLQQEKNGDVVYMSLDDRKMDFNAYLEKLSVEITVDSVQTESETLYQIHPTPAELIELIEKGFFSKTRLVKIK